MHQIQDFSGREYYADEVVDINFPDDQLKSVLTATDMDGTLFRGDLGILVFLEKLGQPSFWTFSVSKFKDLLLPDKYFRLLKKSAEGKISNIAPVRANEMLNLREGIVNLYKLMKQLLKDGGDGLDLSNPIVMSFARMMIAYDDLIMRMDKDFGEHFQGELLLRVRFFAGKNKHDVKGLTRTVLDRPIDSPDAYVDLKFDGDLINGDLGKKLRDLEGLGDLEMDRTALINEEVRRMIVNLGILNGSAIRVVTTNLFDIASAAIENTSYGKIIHPGTEIATTLGVNGDSFTPRMDELPVFGPEKTRKAEAFAALKGRRFAVALGDSPSNDGPMMKRSVENGGVMFAVGDDFEKTRSRFNNLAMELVNSLGEDSLGRMYFIESTKR